MGRQGKERRGEVRLDEVVQGATRQGEVRWGTVQEARKG